MLMSFKMRCGAGVFDAPVTAISVLAIFSFLQKGVSAVENSEKFLFFANLLLYGKQWPQTEFRAAKCRKWHLIFRVEELSDAAELVVTRGKQLIHGRGFEGGKM